MILYSILVLQNKKNLISVSVIGWLQCTRLLLVYLHVDVLRPPVRRVSENCAIERDSGFRTA
jgi:hypothetical protein